ncbi:galactose-1-epimerase [Providencia rustigianii]|uniref:galactose-1-epimerase n=1 Tax=Providencia rustigianii TaxID=158850 RepID=UPI00223E9D98|nr:galactose-1-epimerase [Providencia rustigianii]
MQFTKQQRHTLRTPKVVALTNKDGMKIILSSFGASWVSCILPLDTGKRDVILGAPNMATQMEQRVYFGATIGRVANGFRNPTFNFECETYPAANSQEIHSLSTSTDSFSYRVWAISQPDQQQVVFTLVSPDGDQGFPGELKIEVHYQLTDDNQVIISYRYQSTHDCPVNLTNHTYFNLAGESSTRTALEHDLQILGSHFLPLDENGLPTGELRDVTDTHFDFRQGKRIGRDFLLDEDQTVMGGYDHTIVLDNTTDEPKISASLGAPDGDVRVNIISTLPAVHLYSGNKLISVLGKNKTHTPYSGVVLTTQYPFDNMEQTNSGIAHANQIYTNQTRYQFIF